MNMNAMNFLLGKAVARDVGEERSTQLGLLAGLMPGYQGVLLSAVIARREAPTTPAACAIAQLPVEIRHITVSTSSVALALSAGATL